MLQVMQDTCKVNLDTCIKYISLDEKEKEELIKEVNAVLEVVLKLEES